MQNIRGKKMKWSLRISTTGDKNGNKYINWTNTFFVFISTRIHVLCLSTRIKEKKEKNNNNICRRRRNSIWNPVNNEIDVNVNKMRNE